MLVRAMFVGVVGLGLIAHTPLAAQDRALPPTDVTIGGDGTTATIKWSAVPIDGVTYRVLRSTDSRRTGVDITEPTRETAVVDTRVQAGITYFYQVVAVFQDATTASAPVVAYTAPSAIIAPATAPPPAPLTAITEVAPVRTAMPTEVSGVTVVGNTTASALVSWQPVAGATSYSVKRSWDTYASTITGITTTSWNDLGPSGIGFQSPGLYLYDVTAISPFGNVSGHAAWKRPDPTCPEIPAAQQTLAILDPTKLVSFALPTPVGPTFLWQSGWSRNGAIALRMDRSVQGSGTWAFAGSSCDGTIPPSSKSAAVVIPIKGMSPGTTYLYKLTAYAANGEIGMSTIPWTAPNTSVIHWLTATSNGSTVTLSFRYEPPTTNPPTSPSDRFHLTAPYGLNQIVADGNTCRGLAGCSVVLTGVPSGTHVFTATADWKINGVVVATIWAPTTVIVP